MTLINNKVASNLADPVDAVPVFVTTLGPGEGADLVQALKSRLQNQPVKLYKLPPIVRLRVQVLREIQGENNELEAKFLEERAALENKYQKLYEPLYTKRFKIVNGFIEVEGVTSEEAVSDPPQEKGVPNFWLNALKANEVLAEEISVRDVEPLKYLNDIKRSRIYDSSKGYKLEFYFDTNPYFHNSVLSKVYHMIDEDEPLLDKASGTKIDWLPGKCLTRKLPKPKKGIPDRIRKCQSFFNFFDPPRIPGEKEVIDEERADKLRKVMVKDYEIGITIRDKIIPHAVSWYTGEANGDDDEDEDDDDDLYG